MLLLSHWDFYSKYLHQKVMYIWNNPTVSIKRGKMGIFLITFTCIDCSYSAWDSLWQLKKNSKDCRLIIYLLGKSILITSTLYIYKVSLEKYTFGWYTFPQWTSRIYYWKSSKWKFSGLLCAKMGNTKGKE